jgi:hypothetical protein
MRIRRIVKRFDMTIDTRSGMIAIFAMERVQAEIE